MVGFFYFFNIQPKKECWPGSLGSYLGGVNHTKSGIPCKVWNDESPSSSIQKPEGERADTNFCSEVGDGKAWCYKECDFNSVKLMQESSK